MNRLNEIAERLSAIAAEVETATGDALAALEAEVDALTEERAAILAATESRKALRERIANGTAGTATPAMPQPSEAEARAKAFANTNKITLGVDETRAALVSGGTIATPTGVAGINQQVGVHYSSIVDLVKVVDCKGMGKNVVAYEIDADAAGEQTEGTPGATKEATFDYVEILPTSAIAISQISNQVKMQSPLQYAARVSEQAYISLRKKASSMLVNAMKTSDLCEAVAGPVASSKGKLGADTIRTLVLSYGGDESACGGVLFLNKTDLVALGAIRATDGKAIYEVIADTDNPNMGIIKDGALSVRYCLNKNITAFDGTAQEASTGADKKTMFYGDPMALELDLFSDYTVKVSEDFAFTSDMDTVRGTAEIGAGVVKAGGFVFLNLPKKTS